MYMSKLLKPVLMNKFSRVDIKLNSQMISDVKTNSGTSIKYGNYGHHDVVTTDRFGAITRHAPIPPGNWTNDTITYLRRLKMFVLEVTLRGRREDLGYSIAALSENAKHSNVAKALLLEVSDVYRGKNNTGSNYSVTVTFEVSMHDADEQGKMYLPEFDLVVQFCKPDEDLVVTKNPFEPSQFDLVKHSHVLQTPMSFDCNTGAVIVELFDNSGEMMYKDKYIHMAGRDVKVKVRRGLFPHQPSFVRVRYSNCVNAEGDVKFIEETYSIEEAVAKLGLSDTVEDARYAGDSKLRVSLELAKKQEDIKRIEGDNHLVKLEKDLEVHDITTAAKIAVNNMDTETTKLKYNMAIESHVIKEEENRIKRNENKSKEKHNSFMEIIKAIGSIYSIVKALSSFGKFFFGKPA